MEKPSIYQTPKGEDFRLNPALRLCPRFNFDSLSYDHAVQQGDYGIAVFDNCAEEHIM